MQSRLIEVRLDAITLNATAVGARVVVVGANEVEDGAANLGTHVGRNILSAANQNLYGRGDLTVGGCVLCFVRCLSCLRHRLCAPTG